MTETERDFERYVQLYDRLTIMFIEATPNAPMDEIIERAKRTARRIVNETTKETHRDTEL